MNSTMTSEPIPRYSLRLDPVSGKAIPLSEGEILRFRQVDGRQCVDFNAFNARDYKEHMSVGHSRRQGLHLRQGDVLVSNSPRMRPMLLLADVPTTCKIDTLAARCNAILFEHRFGLGWHTNCQDTLAEAIREYRLTPDDVHDSCNFFMNTVWADDGSWWTDLNTSERTDYVDLVACMDVLAVPIICGSGDITVTSNFWLSPIDIEVYPATDASVNAVSQTKQRFSAPKTRITPESYRNSTILAQRELEIDRSYKPEYRGWPLEVQRLSTDVSEAELQRVDVLIEDGVAQDREEAVRMIIMSWVVRHMASTDRGLIASAAAVPRQ